MSHHPLAVIDPSAIIGKNVVIEPFAHIKSDVVIGDNSYIASHAVVCEGARIGKNCSIFHGAVVSSIPQDLKYENEYATLEIGDNTIVREYCTLNRGTKASGKTVIGSNCLLMAYVHVAHDCIIGNHCVLANNVTLAGHIEVGDWAVLGGLTAVHQFVKIGVHAMVSGGSLVLKDVPPFVKVARNPLSYIGINSIGLHRRQFTQEQINHIQDMYRVLFVQNNNITKGLDMVRTEFAASPEREAILDFIDSSDRGLVRGFQVNASEES